jgi:hypothetical protein
LKVNTTLWTHYRRSMKFEIGNLWHNILLRTLRSATSTTHQKTAILDCLIDLFKVPQNLVEIFFNFDLDQQFFQSTKLFEEMCETLCKVIEDSAVVSQGGTGGGGGGSDVMDATFDADLHPNEKHRVNEQCLALEALLAMCKCVVDVTGHAHLVKQDAKMKQMSMGGRMGQGGGWVADADDDDVTDVVEGKDVEDGAGEDSVAVEDTGVTPRGQFPSFLPSFLPSSLLSSSP